jgi:hypothetical protein
MVMAINEVMPQIISTEYPSDLIQLAREMLHKNWKERLRLVPLDKAKAVLEKCLLPQEEPMNYYEKIKTNALPIQNEIDRLNEIDRRKKEKEKIMSKINNDIWGVIEKVFIENQNLVGMMIFIDSSRVFSMENFKHTLPITNFKFYHLKGKIEYGFSDSFYLFFMVENDANNNAKIYIVGVIKDTISRENIQYPEKLVYELFSEEHKYPLLRERITNPPEIHVEFTCFFDGIVEFGDDSLQKIVDSKIGQLLSKITEKMEKEVKEKLEQQKRMLESNTSFYITTKISQGIIFVN